MRQYSEYSLDRVCNFLTPKKNTLIIFHVRPDADAIGAAFALKLVLEGLGSKALCVCESEIPSRLAFLTENHQRSARFDNMDGSFEFERIITVDTASPSQLGNLQSLFEDKIDLMIDHHENGIKYADYYIRSDYAASGEIIYEIAKRLIETGQLTSIPKDAYDLIYAALSSDTGCFKYSNVTPKTHRIAARLIEMGVEAAKINELCFDSKAPEQIEAEKIAYNNIRILLDGRLVICALDKKTKAGIPNEYFEGAVNIARSVKGTLVSCAVKEKDTQEGSFRVSMRSNVGGVNVAEICASFGGGGHICAAGCSVDASDIDAAIAERVKKVSEVI